MLEHLSPICTYEPDIVFILETSSGYQALPDIKGYRKYADASIQYLNHGGIALYVKSRLMSHVFDMKYKRSFISFRLDYSPKFQFIGTYIQPENSPYYNDDLFCEISELLLSSLEDKLIPILGGDMNCRYGDLNNAFHDLGVVYADNSDTISNNHGRSFGIDLCKTAEMFPINHIIGRKKHEGDFTYFKGGKKSQIDFVYCNKNGLKFIEDFCIPKDDWHLSDHRPIVLDILTPEFIEPSALLSRARELNFEFDPNREQLKRYLASYNIDVFKTYLTNNAVSIESRVMNEIQRENYDKALFLIDESTENAYRFSKLKLKKGNPEIKLMEDANALFEKYRLCLSGESSEDCNTVFQKYQQARNSISKETIAAEMKRWNDVTTDTNSKRLWEKINWKGNFSTQPHVSPDFEDLSVFFENLYKTDDPEENQKIEELKTDVANPVMDDPISGVEVTTTLNKMKKGGFDHKIDFFKIMVTAMFPLILTLLNILFYVCYPVKLAISLLIALPKKGNLRLPKNFRGIQMLTALSVLFDRIITTRLQTWLRVNDVQSAFQKWKSTLHQLFTLRLIIELAKRSDKCVYIGLFDLEKAFDKVSRYKMLKKLVKKGISNIMLQALKRLYLLTMCVLSYGGEISEAFRTWSGIRQGAASSVLLFISFIDDLVNFLEQNCPKEDILDDLHCLLHADDTAILSTDEKLFIYKCNKMLEYFEENSLSLNLSKSGFIVINAGDDKKHDLILRNGVLECKRVVTYLGAMISDTGAITHDVELYVSQKRSNVTIKFPNFCRKNFLAPIETKLNVLNVCVCSSLIYGCETWGHSKFPTLEALYRKGLRTALSVRPTWNNDIIYVETGEAPIELRILKQQIKFWSAIENFRSNPDHYITKLVVKAEMLNIKYIKYYKDIVNKYKTPDSCHSIYLAEHRNAVTQRIRDAAAIDPDSRLGSYLSVNPSLTKPSYTNLLEYQRVKITRYRTGSHNLKIETGRRPPRIDRAERVCRCSNEVQSLKHCLMDCPLLNDARAMFGIEDVANGVMVFDFLLEMERILKC